MVRVGKETYGSWAMSIWAQHNCIRAGSRIFSMTSSLTTCINIKSLLHYHGFAWAIGPELLSSYISRFMATSHVDHNHMVRWVDLSRCYLRSEHWCLSDPDDRQAYCESVPELTDQRLDKEVISTPSRNKRLEMGLAGQWRYLPRHAPSSSLPCDCLF